MTATNRKSNDLNEIQVLPKPTTHGYEFSYATWNAGTVVTMANVPWNSDYRDLVHFDNQAGLDNYLDNLSGPTVTTGNMSYTPMMRPVRLPVPFEQVNRYNYLRAYNPAQPLTSPGGDTGRSYYYFIAAVNYIAPNTTELILQLDVWQSFIYSGVTFGNCYIERGHVGIANQDNFLNYGREYLTVPEGLDVGGEYQIKDQWQRTIASSRNRVAGDAGAYSILVVSTVSLEADPGAPGAPQMHSATGSQMENLPNGAETYIFQDLASWNAFLAAYSDKPWVTQGILSVTAIPPTSVYGPDSTGAVVGGVTVLKANSGSLRTISTPMHTSWRDSLTAKLPLRYQGLNKFKVYPYCVLEMTAYTGTPLVLKPESWGDNDATVVEVPHLTQPGARVMFYPFRYNTDASGPASSSDASGIVNDGGEFLDMATGLFNFPQFSIVNNGYMAYMAANMNGIAFAHSSADWAQQRALAGNQVTAGQASGAINTSRNITGMGINAASQQATLANETGTLRTAVGVGQSLIGGVAGGTPGSALGALSAMAGGVAGNAIDMNQRNQALGIQNTLAGSVNDASMGQAGMVRDTNKAYADMAAHGDYQNAIAGINAKVQDAKMIQPTTSGQVGGDAFLLANYKWGYDIKVKMLQAASMVTLGEYWLRYGYAVNRFGKMPAGFMVCEKFTYWKLRETYITASFMPESFKQALRGIFEKGVTVWKNPSDIGNIDIADNAPLAGVTL